MNVLYILAYFHMAHNFIECMYQNDMVLQYVSPWKYIYKMSQFIFLSLLEQVRIIFWG